MAISVRPSAASRPLREERVAEGKAARKRVPRSSHATWTAPKDRVDPVEVLEAASRKRVPSLVPIWYGRMSVSPFTFLRGAASLMARDLAGTPVSGARAQLCGDAHLSNFGVFATPERDRVFDINDFDETLPGPWEWDVKRLATSLILVSRQNGFSPSVARRVAQVAVRAYRRTMQSFSFRRYLDIWYAHIDRRTVRQQASRKGRKLIAAATRQARHRTVLHAFPKMVRSLKGTPRIRDVPPLIVHYRDPADAEVSRQFFDKYLSTLDDERRVLLERYHIVDVAQKVVGVGSVGTVCSILLLMGDRDVEDPLFLQLKQAQESALEPFAGTSRFENHAERVVMGQHLIQEASDIFLGWSRLHSRDFYFRQLRDMKFSPDVAAFHPKALLGQAVLCGTALSRAHARTGDPAFISGYLGNRDLFDVAVTRFAEAYADQTARDHGALLRAIRAGKVSASVDV
jgi:uncharacterized protein (DUF2252 family)